MSSDCKSRGLSGNMLKILAAVTMAVDHAGMLLFPRSLIFRIIGRLAFPIYAFMIAQGCRYTRSRLKYFLSVFLLGSLCQGAYLVVGGDLYLNVLLTFSLSIPVIYLLQWLRAAATDPEISGTRLLVRTLVVLTAVAGVWMMNEWLTFDYGFYGCMLPVFASLLQPRRDTKADCLSFLDRNVIHVSLLGVGLVLLSLRYGGIQSFSLLSLPFLYAYSGRRGTGNLKTFFYLFYPAHLVILEGIRLLIS